MIDTLLRQEKGSPLTHEEMDGNFQALENAVNARPTNDGTGAYGEWPIDVTGNADNVAGVVQVDHGGTGADNPEQALQNLGAYPASNPSKFITAAQAPVQKVAGRTGDVVLTAADIGGLAASATTNTTNASNITAGTLPAGRLPALTGDITSTAGSAATTLANTSVTAGSYGSNTHATTFTVDSKGRLLAAGVVKITPAFVDVTDKPSTVEGYGITNAVTVDQLGVANGVAQLGPDGRLRTEQIPTSLVGALQYQGTWDASTNTPPVAGMTKAKGHYYKVSVAGTTNVDGQAYWQVGDLLIHNGTGFDRVEGGGTEVTTVAGRVGAIVLTAADIGGLAPSATTDTTNASNISSGTLPVARLPAFGGDATVTAGTSNIVLKDTGVEAGAYGGANAIPTFTVDGKGRLLMAGNVEPTVAWAKVMNPPTTIAGYGITDALKLTTSNPAALGTAAVGTATTAARGDHVHAMPNLDVLANVTIAAIAAGDFLSWNGNKWINTPANTTNVASASKLQTARDIALTGDATGTTSFDGSKNVSLAVTLKDSGVTAASYGSATQAVVVSFDAQGRATLASAVTITPAFSSLTGKPTTIAGYGITDALKLGTSIAKLGAEAVGIATTAAKSDHVHAMPSINELVNVSTSTRAAGDVISYDGTNWTNVTRASMTVGEASVAVKLKTARTVTVSGDVVGTMSFDGSADVALGLQLTKTGVAAGSYGSVGAVPVITVDDEGRVTSVSTVALPTTIGWANVTGKPNTVDGYGITDAVKTSQLGVANGVATLGSDGRLVASQIPSSLLGALVYQGTWNAVANIPELANGTGTQGHYYKVAIAGGTNIGGNAQWNVGDLIIYNGATWDRVEGDSTEVNSVAGRIGNVVLTKADVGLSAVENKSSAQIRSELTASNIVTGLGYTPSRGMPFPQSAYHYTAVAAETGAVPGGTRFVTNPATQIGYAGAVRFRFGYMNDVDTLGGYADVVDFSTYTDSTGGGINALYLNKTTQQIQHKFAAAGATVWTTKTLAYTDSNITGNAANVTGVVAVANGGTGAATPAQALINLNAASLGQNYFTGGQSFAQGDKGTVISGTVSFGWSARNIWKLTVGGALTINTSNWPASGSFGDMLIELVNGGSAAVTFSGISWILPTTGKPAASFAEYLSAIGRNPAALQASGTDWIYLWTTTGGATVNGKIV